MTVAPAVASFDMLVMIAVAMACLPALFSGVMARFVLPLTVLTLTLVATRARHGRLTCLEIG